VIGVREWARTVKLYVALSVLTGLLYPILVTGIAWVTVPHKAGGSPVVRNGAVVGSELIGQAWSSPGYFHGRPSAVNYAADRSGATNVAVSSRAFWVDALRRAMQIRRENGLPPTARVPADLVLGSGSGLDPHISVESALLQVNRVARSRGKSPSQLVALIRRIAEPPQWGVLGSWRVNVLRLNLALDELR
jgi:K+-transporting ATPase ATPase C chain